jgi:hypothetical protein
VVYVERLNARGAGALGSRPQGGGAGIFSPRRSRKLNKAEGGNIMINIQLKLRLNANGVVAAVILLMLLL